MEYSIRKLYKHELGQVLESTLDENWSYTLSVLEEYYSINPEHFYGAVTPDGEVLSHCFWVPLGGMLCNKMGMITFFVTKKQYRQKGIGRSVIRRCIEAIGDMDLGLFSEMDTQSMYSRMGFKYTGILTWCFKGRIDHQRCESIKDPVQEGLEILNITDVTNDAVIRYDTEFIHPVPRDVVLNLLMNNHHSFYVAVWGQSIVGYGCIRKMSKGYQIKPLYANDEKIARALFNILIDSIPSDQIVETQVMSENIEAHKFFERYGMGFDGGKTIQMFTKEVINPPNVGFVYGMMDYVLSIV